MTSFSNNEFATKSWHLETEQTILCRAAVTKRAKISCCFLHINGTIMLNSCCSSMIGGVCCSRGSRASSSRFIIICDGSSRDHIGPGSRPPSSFQSDSYKKISNSERQSRQKFCEVVVFKVIHHRNGWQQKNTILFK